MEKIKILTNDPSFTAWGWAVLNEKGEVIDSGCIKTHPEQKKRRIRKGDDTVRRTSEINKTLIEIIQNYDIKLILSELPYGSQNASAAVMIGIVTGIIQTLADSFDLPVEWFSEDDAKKCVLGRRSATKEEMIEAMKKVYHFNWSGVKYIDEAIADALAIHYVARHQSPLLKFLK